MYNFQKTNNECSECLSRGICSDSPILSSLQEVILLYLKELSFYLIKLKEFGVKNEQIKETVIYALGNLALSVEYNQQQFMELTNKLNDYVVESKTIYKNFCEKNSMDIESIKTYFKHHKNIYLNDAIKRGEKYFLKKTELLTPNQKSLFDIMVFLIKSMSIKLMELRRLGKDHEQGYYAILFLLSSINVTNFSQEQTKKAIDDVLDTYYDILRTIFYTQNELYGPIRQTEVAFSAQLGKAILVSGSDFNKLERVLKACEGKEIWVYTHGVEMLFAHAFPKLQSHPNLKGHFGSGFDSYMMDFASFPGAILMTRINLEKSEYLYRGRLFTMDPVAPPGIIKIVDGDFEPLIKAALESRGFNKLINKPPIKVGFSYDEVEKKMAEITDKILNKEITHIYIVGLLNYPVLQKQYFESFFEFLPSDCYAISLSYNKNRDNVYHLDTINDYVLFYKILKEIKDKIPLDKVPLSIFLTRCDKHTISNLLYLSHLGIKNIYMSKCSANVINPTLFNTIKEVYGVKEIFDAKTDIEDTLR